MGRRRDQEGGGRGAEPGREGFRKKESGEAPPCRLPGSWREWLMGQCRSLVSRGRYLAGKGCREGRGRGREGGEMYFPFLP